MAEKGVAGQGGGRISNEDAKSYLMPRKDGGADTEVEKIRWSNYIQILTGKKALMTGS